MTGQKGLWQVKKDLADKPCTEKVEISQNIIYVVKNELGNEWMIVYIAIFSNIHTCNTFQRFLNSVVYCPMSLVL